MNTNLTDYIEIPHEEKPIKKHYRGVRKKVEKILHCLKSARNRDDVLIQAFIQNETGHVIPLDVLKALPSFESITRCRRKIQEEGLYLAEDAVRKGRAENEEGVREWSVE